MSPFDEWLSKSNFIFGLDLQFITAIGIPAIIVIIGWFFVHWLNNRRDVASRKREALLKAMEAAYLRLANSSNREELTEKMMDDIELFVAEIQLYVTPKQVSLMAEIVEGFKKPNKFVSFDPILMDLRDTLRKELDLEPIPGPVWWLRLDRRNIRKIRKTDKKSV